MDMIEHLMSALALSPAARVARLPNSVNLLSAVRSAPHAASIAPIALLLLVLLVVVLVMRKFRSRLAIHHSATTRQTQTQIPSNREYRTGIFVAPISAKDTVLRKKIQEWQLTHPNDSSVAAALYDQTGNVSLKLYSATTRELLWSGNVGTVHPFDLPDFQSRDANDEIEIPVKTLVRQFLGSALIAA